MAHTVPDQAKHGNPELPEFTDLIVVLSVRLCELVQENGN
jgi:hypothetical protein